MRRLLLAVITALLVSCAPPQDDEFVPAKGCAFIIQSAWNLIEDPSNYMPKPRPGRMAPGYYEASLVLAEGLGQITHRDEYVGYPPNSEFATRWTAMGAYRHYVYVDKDDPNVPAITEAGRFLDEASQAMVGTDASVEIPHDQARKIYERAFAACLERGEAPLYVTTIEVPE